MPNRALLLCLLLPLQVFPQDDLLDLLGDQEQGPLYTTASFKATRVINSHSLENTAHGVLDFKIGHRFGFLSGGASEFFGLDQATIRLGLDYGITDRLVIGVGRSSFQKTVDGFAKYKVLRQCDAGCSMPITLAVVAGASLNTTREEDLPWYDPTVENFYTHRLAYNFQIIAGRKFSESFSLQVMPGLIHKNLVPTANDAHDILNAGIAGRFKLTKRVAINAEYFHVQESDLGPIYENSLSIGFDIETGGHVFQLHATNSTGMFERAFITETVGRWSEGEIHFGFNISRVFTLHDPKAKARRKAESDGKG